MTQPGILAVHARPLAFAALLLFGGGCVSVRENRPVKEFSITPGVTTKEQVIRALGVSGGAWRQGEDIVYSFPYNETNGTGYGLGMMAGAVLALESTHTALDRVEVVIGPDRVVRSVRIVSTDRMSPWIP